MADGTEVAKPTPPFFQGHNVLVYNTATLLSLTPMVELPLAQLSVSSLTREVMGLSQELHHSSGLLLPLERLPYVAPSFRRMKIAVDYSKVVSLPVDQYEQPLISVVKKNTDDGDEKEEETQTTTKKKKRVPTKTMPFIFLPTENPSRLRTQVRLVFVAVLCLLLCACYKHSSNIILARLPHPNFFLLFPFIDASM